MENWHWLLHSVASEFVTEVLVGSFIHVGHGSAKTPILCESGLELAFQAPPKNLASLLPVSMQQLKKCESGKLTMKCLIHPSSISLKMNIVILIKVSEGGIGNLILNKMQGINLYFCTKDGGRVWIRLYRDLSNFIEKINKYVNNYLKIEWINKKNKNNKELSKRSNLSEEAEILINLWAIPVLCIYFTN